MKGLLLIVAVLAFTLLLMFDVWSQMPLYGIFPPVKYDYEYEGDLTIEMVDTQAEVQTMCRVNNPHILACSWQNGKSCLILMVRDEVMRERGYSTGLLLRHERGHCNGWSGAHEGERPLPLGSTYLVPKHERVPSPTAYYKYKSKDPSRIDSRPTTNSTSRYQYQ